MGYETVEPPRGPNNGACLIEEGLGLERRVWHFRPSREGVFGRLLVEDGLICAEFGVRDDLSEHYEPGQILDAVTGRTGTRSRPGSGR